MPWHVRLLIGTLLTIAVVLIATADPRSYGGAWLSGACWHRDAPPVCNRPTHLHMSRFGSWLAPSVYLRSR